MDFVNWKDFLVPGIPVFEKVLRPVIVYVFLVAGLRLSGKRELAQLNPFDFVVLLTLSNTVQNAIIGNDNSLAGGLIGAAALLAVNYMSVRFIFSHRSAEAAIEGSADVLMADGRLVMKNLKKNLITESELVSAARKQGFSSLEEVEGAMIDPDGVVSFSAAGAKIEESRHAELIKRIDSLEREIKRLGKGRRNA